MIRISLCFFTCVITLSLTTIAVQSKEIAATVFLCLLIYLVLSLRGQTLQGLGLYSCWNAVLEVVLVLW